VSTKFWLRQYMRPPKARPATIMMPSTVKTRALEAGLASTGAPAGADGTAASAAGSVLAGWVDMVRTLLKNEMGSVHYFLAHRESQEMKRFHFIKYFG